MAGYITRIRTESGDMQIDYNALANLPDIDGKISSTLSPVKSDVSKLQNQCTTLQDANNATNNTLTALTNTHATDISDLNAKIAANKKSINSLNQGLGDLQINFNTINLQHTQDITALQEDITALQEVDNTVTGILNDYQLQLEQHTEDIGALQTQKGTASVVCIWKNSNPKDAFGIKTENFSATLNSTDLVLILCRKYIVGALYDPVVSFIGRVGDSIEMEWATATGFYQREVVIAAENFTVANCYKYEYGSETPSEETYNSYFIIDEIYKVNTEQN